MQIGGFFHSPLNTSLVLEWVLHLRSGIRFLKRGRFKVVQMLVGLRFRALPTSDAVLRLFMYNRLHILQRVLLLMLQSELTKSMHNLKA